MLYINKTKFLSTLLLLVSVSAFASSKATVSDNSKKALDIQTWQTTQGTAVYFVEAKQIPMVDIQVVFNAGSAQDGAKPGLAQFTNAMLNQGTATATADQIASDFDKVGAVFSASSGRDMAAVGLRSLVDPKFFDPAFKTFINVLTTTNFPLDAFQRTQKQIIISLEYEKQQPGSVATNAFSKALYGDQPYGHPPAGTSSSIPTITRQDLLTFYQRFYVAKNALIAIVGNLNRNQAETIAQQISNQLPPGSAAPNLKPVGDTTQAVSKHVNFPSEQTTILLGDIGINQQNPDFFPLLVGNYTLGGSLLTSRLYQTVREKNGLVYGINSAFVPLAANGPFYIGLQTRNGEAKKAIALTKQVLDEFIKNGPTDKEIMAAKKNIIGGFPLSIASNAAIMAQIINIGFYHLPLDYLDTYRSKINAVTNEQIRAAFRKHINPEAMVMVTVGPDNLSAIPTKASNAKNQPK